MTTSSEFWKAHFDKEGSNHESGDSSPSHCTFYSWSKTGSKLHRPKDKPNGKYARRGSLKFVDIFKFYLRKCLAAPVTGISQTHIQLMCNQLTGQEEIRFAVRLELILHENGAEKDTKMRAKYLAIVRHSNELASSKSSINRIGDSSTAVFGFDISESKGTTVGMVFPVVPGVKISFYGDGKFMIHSPTDKFNYVFRPVSVQAMWYCFQSLERCINDVQLSGRSRDSIDLDWIDTNYALTSPELLIAEWKTFPDEEFDNTLASSFVRKIVADELSDTEQVILGAVRKICLNFNLEEVSSKTLLEAAQEHLGADHTIQLKQHKSTFDKLLMIACNQIEAPSQIFDHVYLGNEGNATNRDELKALGITHILNISNEIDNVFPLDFTYLKIQVNDEPDVKLINYWKDNTAYDFIHGVKTTEGCKVLVHCKMGMSRSASTVIAYAMKEYRWTLEEAFKHVKSKRPIIRPNRGFMNQLQVYNGILEAKSHKNSILWNTNDDAPIFPNLKLGRSESGRSNTYNPQSVSSPTTPVGDSANHDVSALAQSSKRKSIFKPRLQKRKSLESGKADSIDSADYVLDSNLASVKETKQMFECGMFDVCVRLTGTRSLNMEDVQSSLFEDIPVEEEVPEIVVEFEPDEGDSASICSKNSQKSFSRKVSQCGECSEFSKSSADSRKTSDSIRKPRVDVSDMVKKTNQRHPSVNSFLDYSGKPRRCYTDSGAPISAEVSREILASSREKSDGPIERHSASSSDINNISSGIVQERRQVFSHGSENSGSTRSPVRRTKSHVQRSPQLPSKLLRNSPGSKSFSARHKHGQGLPSDESSLWSQNSEDLARNNSDINLKSSMNSIKELSENDLDYTHLWLPNKPTSVESQCKSTEFNFNSQKISIPPVSIESCDKHSSSLSSNDDCIVLVSHQQSEAEDDKISISHDSGEDSA